MKDLVKALGVTAIVVATLLTYLGFIALVIWVVVVMLRWLGVLA